MRNANFRYGCAAVIATLACACADSLPEEASDPTEHTLVEESADVQEASALLMMLATPECKKTSTLKNSVGSYVVPVAGNGSDKCWLAQGSTGSAVRALQQAIKVCWIGNSNAVGIAVDGIYGSQTASGIRFLQKEAGITADGIYGPQTRRMMGHNYARPDGRCNKQR